MKLTYDAQTDSLTILFSDRPADEGTQVAPGAIVDLDAQGEIVAIDISPVEGRIDLESLVTEGVPVSRLVARASMVGDGPYGAPPQKS